MATYNVVQSGANNTTSFLNVRDAINKVESGDTVSIATGTFSAVSYDPTLPQNANTGYCGFFNAGLSRFASANSTTINEVTISGNQLSATTSDTIITNLDRIYTNAKDAGYSRPTAFSITDLQLNFNFTGSSEYILQGGEYTNNANPLPDFSIFNVTFDGTHRGSANSGAYSDLRAATNFLFENSTVSKNFGNQQTFVAGNQTTPSSGGSAFLFLQGSGMMIKNNTFNESNYSNSVTIYDSSSTNISNNRFDAGGQLKSRGQIFSNSDGQINNNIFRGGTFLNLRKPTGNFLNVTGNTFQATSVSEPTKTVAGGKGILLDPNTGNTSFSQFSSYNISGNTFNDVVPIVVNVSTGGTGLKTPGNLIYDPVQGATQFFDCIVVGGSGSDTLSGAANFGDFIIGAQGADTLTGGTGADAFAFTTTPGGSNVDTITDFRGSLGDRIWLDDAIFKPLAKGALSAFGTYINFDATARTLWYDSTGAGLTSGSALQICTFNGTSVNPTASQFIIF